MSDLSTAFKRATAMNVGCPWRGPLVFELVAFNQGDRQAADFMYSGLLASSGAAATVGKGLLESILFDRRSLMA